MSDPTLGFQVDTSGLDKGSQSLDKITQSAAKTEQQAGKTSEALNKMGSGSSGNSIAKTAQSVDKMAESLVRASREAQKNLDVTKSLESIVSKTGTSYTQAAASLQSAINAHKSSAAAVTTNTEAVKKSADAHAVLSTQAQSAFHSNPQHRRRRIVRRLADPDADPADQPPELRSERAGRARWCVWRGGRQDHRARPGHGVCGPRRRRRSCGIPCRFGCAGQGRR
ncbi:hypothetical protein [Bradyrhizobium diazoefficiens]